MNIVQVETIFSGLARFSDRAGTTDATLVAVAGGGGRPALPKTAVGLGNRRCLPRWTGKDPSFCVGYHLSLAVILS